MPYNRRIHSTKKNIPKIFTSGIAGIAGGITLAAMIPVSGAGLIISGLAAAGITGYAEYKREKNSQTITSLDEENTENYL